MTTASRSSSKAKRKKARKKAKVIHKASGRSQRASATRKAGKTSPSKRQRGKAPTKKTAKRRAPAVASKRKTKATARPRPSKKTGAKTATSRKVRPAVVREVAGKGKRTVAGGFSQKTEGGGASRGQQLRFGFTDERSELAVLQKQNRNLLLKIAKRRALIAVSKQAVDELMRELSERVIPYREELFAITRELCDLKERLLESSGLTASQLEKVRWTLTQLLTSLPVEEAEDAERSERDENEGSHGKAAAEARGSQDVHAATGARVADADRERTDSNSRGAQTGRREGDGSERGAASTAATAGEVGAGATQAETARRESPSAAKPAGDQSGALRTLFKKLAITYHPDRVQDEASKSMRTKIMKELTQAFESADLARLLELERTLAARTSGVESRETPERQRDRLVQSNVELQRQLAELDEQLDRIKEDSPFTLDLRLRDPARVAHDELDQLVLDRHMEVERASKTRDFVASFAAGRMKVADFLKGPPHVRRLSEAQFASLLK